MSLSFSNIQRSQLPDIEAMEKQLFAQHGYPAFFLRQAYDCWRSGFMVAECEHQIAGYVLIVPKADKCNEAWMLSLAVSPAYQGRGIAKQLVKYALARQSHYQKIYLTVAPDNLPARAIYQSCGFEILTEEENYFDDGESRLVMCRIAFNPVSTGAQ
ncbi:TPA: GNAT family N-acetyltransferase [Vibrio vulnificus]|uniref:GNAT family N-acetyltransferase n=1 Tax=Vibrio vulnificus TaxID=672 RepID=UPI001A1B652F|nr:GNAT family N-acetyltransferase [Vibrio vulnificus]HDY7475665.1 GNAT family N-acetyltransferase [Vibrio vulnificus]HDY7491185.1 GNAT family N-acetyltransferase [Vibrio vulnificus]HDY8128351.1 GNAT family N-acetyltransferase [Vibrio vulnificus]HDY8133656.1 GNAT family N-acetyltransferase [Vibrio vulnificus]